MNNNKALGTACGVSAVLIWAGFASVIALANNVAPLLYVGITYVIGFLIFCIRWYVRKESVCRTFANTPWWFFIVVIAGIGLHDLTWIAAIQNAPPEQAALIIYQWPMLTTIFTAISLKQRLTLPQIIGCALGMTGVFVLLTGKGVSLTEIELSWGHLYALISALLWSLYSALAARYQNISSNIISINFLVFGAITMFLWGVSGDKTEPDLWSLLVVSFYAIFFSSAYVLWDHSMKRGDAQFVVIFSFLIPALSVIFLVLFGFSTASYSLFISVTLILAGIFIAKLVKA